MEERGIIMTHKMGFNPIGQLFFKDSITPDDVRKNLLYWDFIDFPRTSDMKVDLRTNEENILLIEQGFIKQTDLYAAKAPAPGTIVQFEVHKICENAILGQLELLNEYASQGLRCAVSQHYIDQRLLDFYVPKSIQKARPIIEFELINCLPYPSIDTKIADVLEFKDRRKDELIQLRQALENLNTTATKNPDKLKDKNLIQELEEKIRDVDTVLKENKFNIFTTPTKILVDIPKEIVKDFKSIFTDISITTALGFPIDSKEFLMVTGARAIINTTAKTLLGPKQLPENIKDFAYIYHAKKELTMPQLRKPKINRNDKVNVEYADGAIKKNVKYKYVQEDIEASKCKLIE